MRLECLVKYFASKRRNESYYLASKSKQMTVRMLNNIFQENSPLSFLYKKLSFWPPMEVA